MSYQQTKYERDDPRNTDPLVDKTLGNSYWVIREIYKNLPFLRFLSDKVANLDIQNVEFRSNHTEQRIEWKYQNQLSWNVLVSYEDLLSDSLAQALVPINTQLDNQYTILDAFAETLNTISSTISNQSLTILSTIERVEVLEEGNETSVSGWTPILSLVPDDQRVVMQVTDWTGGVGTKPPVGVYIGSTGYVTDIAEAENLKGDQGVNGEAGANGVGVPVGGTTGQVLAKASNTDLDTQWIDPTEGEDGGTPGADGKSAYEVAVENGFIGTEEAWLLSLKGDTGETGAQGDQGPQGIQGEPGDNGLDGVDGVGVPVGGTTGQVLAKASNTDLDTEWIDPPTGGGGGDGVSYFLDVRHNAGQLVAGTPTTLLFGNKVEDTLSAYNTGTGVFVVPAELDGTVVQMTAATQFTTTSSATSELRIERSTNNGSSWDRVVQTGQATTLFGLMNITTSLRLVAGHWYRVLANAGASYTTVDNERSFFRVVSTATARPPVDLSLYIAGMPDADEVIFKTVMARELTLAGNMAGSVGHVGVNPTVAAATFLVKRNGSTAGQVVFDLAGDALFTTIGPGNPQVFGVGDVMEVVAPSTQNATMADISITFVFTREV